MTALGEARLVDFTIQHRAGHRRALWRVSKIHAGNDQVGL
jgi:hypothetical protein